MPVDASTVQVGYPDGKSPEDPTIRTIAICAGSGESVVYGVKADLYFTGELAHHVVLAAIAGGGYVALCTCGNLIIIVNSIELLTA